MTKYDADNEKQITIKYDPPQKELYMKEDPDCIYPQFGSRKGIHRRGGNFAAMVARKHFEDRGFVVPEKYLLVRCPNQREYNEGFITICKTFGKDKMLLVLKAAQHLKGGDPDLFVYREDLSKSFFVEAKAQGDKLSANQIELISIIRKFLCPVYIANIIPKVC